MTTATTISKRRVAGIGLSRLLLSGLLLITAIGTLGVAATGAIFTDTESVSANAFSTGTLDLSASPSSAVVSLSGMAPGDEVVAPLEIANDGSLELRYAVESETTENFLASQLEMKIKTGVTDCNESGFNADGTVVYSGILGSVGGTNVIGNPAQGSDSGDRVLAAASSEKLCIKVELPGGTGNSYQGQSTSATFTVYAEQTINNS